MGKDLQYKRCGSNRKKDGKISVRGGGIAAGVLRPGASPPILDRDVYPFFSQIPCSLMKRLLFVVAVLLTVGLSSCQCADKPDIGPVEGDEKQSQVHPASGEPDIHPV